MIEIVNDTLSEIAIQRWNVNMFNYYINVRMIEYDQRDNVFASERLGFCSNKEMQ